MTIALAEKEIQFQQQLEAKEDAGRAEWTARLVEERAELERQLAEERAARAVAAATAMAGFYGSLLRVQASEGVEHAAFVRDGVIFNPLSPRTKPLVGSGSILGWTLMM